MQHLTRLCAALALCLLPALAFGQGAVLQSGPVVPQHAACWGGNGVIYDCGSPPSFFIEAQGGEGYNNIFYSPTLSGTVAGSPTASGNWIFSGTVNVTGPLDLGGYAFGIGGALSIANMTTAGDLAYVSSPGNLGQEAVSSLSISFAQLPALSANTLLGALTATTPSGVAVPSCSATGDALYWTAGTGFGCFTGYAPLASPALTGIPTAPTASAGTSTTQLATTAFVAGSYAPIASPTFTGTVTIPSGASISGFAPLASPALTGTPTAPTAAAATSTTQVATTANVVNTIEAPPAAGYGSATPEPVAATTISATGAITPSQTNGIVGTTTGNSANAGSVGEFVCAQVWNGGSPSGCATNSSTPVSLTTNNTPANVTSVSLTAGDWTCFGSVNFYPAGTTTVAAIGAAISTVSATEPTAGSTGALAGLTTTFTTGALAYLPAGQTRVLLSTTTTVYLVAESYFGVSTMTAGGYIGCRRSR